MALYDQALADHDAALAGLQPGERAPEPPERPQIRPWLRDPVWCTGCQGRMREELSRFHDLWAAVAMLPPGIRPVASGPEHERVFTSLAHPSPSPACDDLDELRGWLRDWREVLTGEDAMLPRYEDESAEIRAAVADLYASFPRMIASPDYGESYGREIRRWHRALEDAAHEGSYRKFFPQPCPKCGHKTLWERPGEEYVACVRPECQARPTRSELAAVADRRRAS